MRFTLVSCLVTSAVLTATAASPPGKGGGIVIPIAKHSSLFNDDKSVKLEALNYHVASVKAKLLQALENFETNTGLLSTANVKGAEKRGAGVPLTDYNHHEGWYGHIEVGTPPKPFAVFFDTGSSNTFLPKSTCRSCKGHRLWNPSSSSTSKNLHNNFSLAFGSGTVSGGLYTDDVSIAGFTARNQTLGAAESYIAELEISQFHSAGLMGMGYQSIALHNSSPVFQSLVSQRQVKDPRFAFRLSSSGAELHIGGSNHHFYTGEFSYTSVTQEAVWRVMLDSVQGNGQTIVKNIDCVIDTGTTFIVGNASDVSALYSAIGGNSIGSGYYTFPCNSSFPTISLTFGGKSFPIAASALNVGPLWNDTSQCLSGIIGQNSCPFWVIGGTFLQSVYTVFDLGKSRVGFAQLA